MRVQIGETVERQQQDIRRLEALTQRLLIERAFIQPNPVEPDFEDPRAKRGPIRWDPDFRIRQRHVVMMLIAVAIAVATCLAVVLSR